MSTTDQSVSEAQIKTNRVYSNICLTTKMAIILNRAIKTSDNGCVFATTKTLLVHNWWDQLYSFRTIVFAFLPLSLSAKEPWTIKPSAMTVCSCIPDIVEMRWPHTATFAVVACSVWFSKNRSRHNHKRGILSLFQNSLTDQPGMWQRVAKDFCQQWSLWSRLWEFDLGVHASTRSIFGTNTFGHKWRLLNKTSCVLPREQMN